MTFETARAETIALFGEDSFTETDEDLPDGKRRRYYVGACPTEAGPYQGFMAYSWEEVVTLAKKASTGAV